MASVRIAAIGEVPEGMGKQFSVGGRKVAMFKSGGVFYALDDTCPHRGAPLSEGECFEGEVTCPWHGARFSLQTGANLSPPAQAPVASYKVTIVGDDVYVDLP
jgi:nitrite reductase/ring-hydroxylating ferredoxin subunit